MAVETAEMVVNRCCVEKRREAVREVLRQAALVFVIDVEVIFEAQHRGVREGCWGDHACNDAAAFLLRGETPRHRIKPVRIEPLFGVGVYPDGVAALHALARPSRGVADEMAWIEQGDGPRGRLLLNVVKQPEIHNGTGGNADADILQGKTDARRQLDGVALQRGRHMNELLRVVGKNDPVKGMLLRREIGKGVIRRV